MKMDGELRDTGFSSTSLDQWWISYIAWTAADDVQVFPSRRLGFWGGTLSLSLSPLFVLASLLTSLSATLRLFI
jgi:hypothetical protein